MNKFLLHQLLEDSASKFPDKVAVRLGECTITYRELEEKSSRLASILTDMGFKPRNVVGIYLNKSIEAIISIFAILKAGGAYIPLDLHYSPINRIKSILKLSGVNFLISDSKQWTHLLSDASSGEEFIKDIKLIFLDNMKYSGKYVEKKQLNLIDMSPDYVFYDDSYCGRLISNVGVTDDDLAYILYTSGSTGVPKGVMLTHLNALTFINWSLSYFEPDFTDEFSSFAPFHFDLSIFDIFVSIACGGCLNIVPFNISNNPRSILEWISKNKITYMYSVPSVWVTMMSYANIKPDALIGLKKILFAGEVFPFKYLARLMELVPLASYYNLYGPTETNVCTYYHVEDINKINDQTVPIGQACANTEILVLNDMGQPVSIGEEGELLVKGSIVTKGYYKDPEKTKAAFIQSPLPHHHGAGFYKTGDIVRLNKDNLYEYIGRVDLMVKCSGFRIELQEIEHALYKCKSVEEAVVVPIFDNSKENVIICAVLKMKQGEKLSVINMKNFLAELLPKYMIPERIEEIEEITKMANGKTDRQKIVERLKINI